MNLEQLFLHLLLHPFLIPCKIMSFANNFLSDAHFMESSLREKCPNTEFFLVRIFLYSDWLQEIRANKKFVFGHFSRRAPIKITIFLYSSGSKYDKILFTLCVCVCVCVCVYVCQYSSNVKASSVCKMYETHMRGTDQRSSFMNMDASAKFLHLRI